MYVCMYVCMYVSFYLCFIKNKKKLANTTNSPSSTDRSLPTHKLVSFGSIAGNVMRVKAFLPFLPGVPARYTELHHRAYPGWLVGKTQVFICPSHDHMLSKLI